MIFPSLFDDFKTLFGLIPSIMGFSKKCPLWVQVFLPLGSNFCVGVCFLKMNGFCLQNYINIFKKMNRFFFWFFYVNLFISTDKLMFSFLKIPKIQFRGSSDNCWTHQITLFLTKNGQKVNFFGQIWKKYYLRSIFCVRFGWKRQ